MTTLKMSAVAAVVGLLTAMVLLLARAIAWLDVRYAEAVGSHPRSA